MRIQITVLVLAILSLTRFSYGNDSASRCDEQVIRSGNDAIELHTVEETPNEDGKQNEVVLEETLGNSMVFEAPPDSSRNQVNDPAWISRGQKEGMQPPLLSLSDFKRWSFFQWAVGGLIVLIAIGLGKLMRIQSLNTETTDLKARSVEVVLAFLVLILIGTCAYHLVDKIISMNAIEKVAEQLQHPNGDKAVLCAYEQLSEELGRWFALFVIIGAFFGLVMPVGGYLWQNRNLYQQQRWMAQRAKDAERKTRQDLMQWTAEQQIRFQLEIDRLFLMIASQIYATLFNLTRSLKNDWASKKVSAGNGSQYVLHSICMLHVVSALSSRADKQKSNILGNLNTFFMELKASSYDWDLFVEETKKVILDISVEHRIDSAIMDNNDYKNILDILQQFGVRVVREM